MTPSITAITFISVPHGTLKAIKKLVAGESMEGFRKSTVYQIAGFQSNTTSAPLQGIIYTDKITNPI